MCVIIIADKPVDPAVLHQCELANGDGGGIAWREGGLVHWEKGISAKRILRLAAEKPFPHVYHFRIATVGGYSKQLCHPFPVTDSVSLDKSGAARSVFFHNGHWVRWEDAALQAAIAGYKLPKGPYSDSRIMAWLVGKIGPRILDVIHDQKTVLFTPTTCTHYGEGWREKDGTIFSNLNWEYPLLTQMNKIWKKPPTPYDDKSHWSYVSHRGELNDIAGGD